MKFLNFFYSMRYGLLLSLIPSVCFAQNFNYDDRDYDFLIYGPYWKPLPLSVYAMLIFNWIFPLPIAIKKERYGKSFGWSYWKWVGIFTATAFIFRDLGWFGFFLMIGIFLIGLFWRTADEYTSDLISSVENDLSSKKLNFVRDIFDKEKSESSESQEKLRTQKFDSGHEVLTELNQSSSQADSIQPFNVYNQGMTYMISGHPHKFNGSEFVRIQSGLTQVSDSSNFTQSLVQKTVNEEPHPYNGGMIFMISGMPHQFNGKEFERVNTEKSVVINGATFIWNGQNFIHQN